METRLRAAARRRRVVRWSLVALFLVVVGGWTGYQTLGGANRLVSPVSVISANPIAGDWPMFQRSPAHAAFVSDDVPIPAGKVKWRFETEAPILSSPAVVQGVVYLSTGDRRVVALKADSGELIWERGVTGPVDSSPAVAGDLVFIGLKDGRVLALAKADGTIQWEFPTGGLIYSSPSVYRGVVYIGSNDNKLYALDALTGKKRWSYSTGGRVLSDPAVHENVVAVTSQDRHIYILDADTGKHRLDFLTSVTKGAPALDEQMAYVADTGGLLLAIDWSKRELPFEKTARWIRTQLFVWNMVGSLPPPNGFVWRFRNPSESFIGTPAIGAGMVYIASESGTVYALNRTDGQLVWKFTADATIKGSPSIAGQTLYVGDIDGVLYGLDALTGEALWRFQVNGRISSTPVVANGMLYIASDNGTLYAIE
ncbi:MAG: PQQ-binding-like beta-propeller repeat protein [Chloroflexi bacterium]|nr:PQQ-binding-like beta-propeller repeat protein [Chloroflexota bacterium]